MKLLLDTHIFLWSLLEPNHLSKRVASALDDSANEIWLSPVSVWETMVLAKKRRIILRPNPLTWIRDVLKTVPFREAALNFEVAMLSQDIGLHHPDPADRFLAATAMVYDLTLVTADDRLLRLRKLSTLANT
jgi:PIN domain nuclease of toxin-antitoxin system